MEDIILSEDQIVHFNRINNDIATKHPFILNTSQTGSGKTIDVIQFIRVNKIKRVIVICNGSLHIDHWRSHFEKYQITSATILTYDTLRGSRTILFNGRQMVQHGLLYKDEDEYEPTETFKMWIEEGLLLVCDECHLIKNDSGRTNSVKALSRYITIRNLSLPLPHFKSWTMFLSATPYDLPIHTINFAQVCGVIRSDTLYCKETDKPKGILELYQYCNHFNPEQTNIIWGTYDIKSKNVTDVVYKLMTDVFLRLISSFALNCQRNYLSKQSVYYAYFDIDKVGIEMMKRALAMIKAPIRNKFQHVHQYKIEPLCELNDTSLVTNPEINSVLDVNDPVKELSNLFNSITLKSNLIDRDGVIHGMITCQSVKTFFAVLKFVTHIFNTVENSKIVIFLNYKESIDIIMRYLSHYNPVKITGDSECTEEVRNRIRSKFNEPNLESRLLLIISQVGSDGIELDDKNGSFPRIGLGFPDFYHSRFFQCPGRLFRRYTKSNSLFFWCLINSDECPEESVFKSINNKSKVMEETLQNNQIIPPIYYEKIVNPDLMDLNLLLANAGIKSLKPDEPVGLVENKIIRITKSSMSKKF